MISEFLIEIIWLIITPVINIAPGITGIIENLLQSTTFISAIGVFKEYLELVTYLIPVHAFKPIFALIIAIWLFKVVVNILKTLWGILPIA